MTQLMRAGSVSIGNHYPTDTTVITSSSLTNRSPPMPHFKESSVVGGIRSPLTPTSSISPRSDDTMSPSSTPTVSQSMETNPMSAPNSPPPPLSAGGKSPKSLEFLNHPINQHPHHPTAAPPMLAPPHQQHHFISRHPGHPMLVVTPTGSPQSGQFGAHFSPPGLTSLSSTETTSPPPTKTSFCIEALLSKGQREQHAVSRPQPPSIEDQHHQRMMSAELAQRFMMRGGSGGDHQGEQEHQQQDDEDMRFADDRDYSPSPDEDGSRWVMSGCFVSRRCWQLLNYY